MVQGYAQANTPNPSGRSSNYGNQGGYFRGSKLLQSISPYSRSHLHEQWGVCQTEGLKLREPSEIRRETGVLMLTISSLKRFYYIPGVTDMRCGYSRLLQIVKQMTHHDPYNGDVFVFMSKDRRKVKMVHFENHAYYIHEKVFTNGYSFMLLEYRNENGLNSYNKTNWQMIYKKLRSGCLIISQKR